MWQSCIIYTYFSYTMRFSWACYHSPLSAWKPVRNCIYLELFSNFTEKIIWTTRKTMRSLMSKSVTCAISAKVYKLQVEIFWFLIAYVVFNNNWVDILMPLKRMNYLVLGLLLEMTADSVFLHNSKSFPKCTFLFIYRNGHKPMKIHWPTLWRTSGHSKFYLSI